MTESNKIYTKNFGTKREVYDGIAFQTRGGLTKESLFVDENSVLKSRKQVDSLKVNKKIKETTNAVPEVDDDNSGDDDNKTKAIDISKYNIAELKALISQMSLKMNEPTPKMSKLKKNELIDIAVSLSC